jgi:hypothetical protein
VKKRVLQTVYGSQNILVRPNARGLQVLEKEEVDRLVQVRLLRCWNGCYSALA